MHCTHPAAAAAERTFQETMTESLPPFNRPGRAFERNPSRGNAPENSGPRYDVTAAVALDSIFNLNEYTITGRIKMSALG
jgi:hypothetical protein